MPEASKHHRQVRHCVRHDTACWSGAIEIDRTMPLVSYIKMDFYKTDTFEFYNFLRCLQTFNYFQSPGMIPLVVCIQGYSKRPVRPFAERETPDVADGAVEWHDVAQYGPAQASAEERVDRARCCGAARCPAARAGGGRGGPLSAWIPAQTAIGGTNVFRS